MSKFADFFTSAGGPQWPKLKRKQLTPKILHGVQMFLVREYGFKSLSHAQLFNFIDCFPAPLPFFKMEGCLSLEEAQKFISNAESIGFQHQGSRGAAYGEVRINFCLTSSAENAGQPRSFFTSILSIINHLKNTLTGI